MAATMRWKAALGIAVLALPAAPWAQGQVWTVDAVPGAGADFTEIQPAIDAAADGDTILVRAGTYPGFQIKTKSLTVAADSGADVWIHGVIYVNAGLTAGLDVVLRGINALAGTPDSFPLWVTKNLGTVWIEDGSFVNTGHGLEHGALVEECAAVVLTRCSFVGGPGNMSTFPIPGGSGLSTRRSSVAAYECVFQGGPGKSSGEYGGDGGHGVSQQDGFLYLASSTLAGGPGGAGGMTFDRTWFCTFGGDGGSGLFLEEYLSPPLAVHDGGSFAGAPGGPPHAECDAFWTGPDGVPIQVLAGSVTALAVAPTSLVAASPVRELDTAVLRFHAQAGDLAFAVVAPAAGSTYLPALQGVLATAAPTWVLPAGAVPPGGFLFVPVAAPALAPGTEAVLLHAQGAFFRPATAQVQLGAPTALTILDQAF